MPRVGVGVGRHRRSGGLPAPVLSWTSDDTTFDPVFSLTGILESDVVELQIDDASDFASLFDSDSNTVDNAEALSGSLTFAGISSLTPGVTFYARARITRGGSVSGWSNTVSKAMSLYSAEATAYFAAMSVAPDTTRKGHLSTLISSLKTAGVWTKLDALYIMAAHDAQAARVNAVTPASVATTSGTLTFTTDRGYAGNGTTGYLNTAWNPTTASSPKFTRDDAHMAVWSRTANNSGNDVGLTSYARLASNYFGNARTYNNVNGVMDIPHAGSAVGHFLWTRRTSTAYEGYKNAASGASGSYASAALVNAPFLIAAANSHTSGGVTAADFSSNQLTFVHWGSQLSAGEITSLYNALNTYKTAVGA